MSGRAARTLWLALYAIAMGLLEAAVVVYLRALFYPGGFGFPLVEIPPRLEAIEIVREATTILMLLAVAVLAGRGFLERFYAFAFLFGVWDLVYYAGLRVVLGWPDSLLTWDVLFLIPVPWLAPVLYPVTVSLLLVTGFAAREWLLARGTELAPSAAGWWVAGAGAILVVVCFCWNFRLALTSGTPERFPAPLFGAALVVAVAPFVTTGVRALRP